MQEHANVYHRDVLNILFFDPFSLCQGNVQGIAPLHVLMEFYRWRHVTLILAMHPKHLHMAALEIARPF